MFTSARIHGVWFVVAVLPTVFTVKLVLYLCGCWSCWGGILKTVDVCPVQVCVALGPLRTHSRPPLYAAAVLSSGASLDSFLGALKFLDDAVWLFLLLEAP